MPDVQQSTIKVQPSSLFGHPCCFYASHFWIRHNCTRRLTIVAEPCWTGKTADSGSWLDLVQKGCCNWLRKFKYFLIIISALGCFYVNQAYFAVKFR